jgi:hypothetical protein
MVPSLSGSNAFNAAAVSAIAIEADSPRRRAATSGREYLIFTSSNTRIDHAHGGIFTRAGEGEAVVNRTGNFSREFQYEPAQSISACSRART